MTDFATAEAAIRQLHAIYTDAVWRKDYDLFAACFTEDCEWRIGGIVLRGRDVIVAHVRNVFPKFQWILMTFRTPVLQIGDGVATGRTYVTEQSVFQDGTPFAPIGTYFERFVEQDGQWKFAWRLFQTNYIGPPDQSGRFVGINPDFGPPPAMPPLDAPTYNYTGMHTQELGVAPARVSGPSGPVAD